MTWFNTCTAASNSEVSCTTDFWLQQSWIVRMGMMMMTCIDKDHDNHCRKEISVQYWRHHQCYPMSCLLSAFGDGWGQITLVAAFFTIIILAILITVNISIIIIILIIFCQMKEIVAEHRLLLWGRVTATRSLNSPIIIIIITIVIIMINHDCCHHDLHRWPCHPPHHQQLLQIKRRQSLLTDSNGCSDQQCMVC